MFKRRKSNKINIVSPQLLKDIYTARGELSASTDFDLIKQQIAISELDREADRHSIRLERFGGKNAHKAAFRDLRRAKEYLFRSGPEITADKLKVAVSVINGGKFTMDYREETARTNGVEGPLIYPDWTVVPNEMYKFILANDNLDDPVEKAIHSHFHIARIHPFIDGNGRLARIVQNCILEKDRFPPISIEDSERTAYLFMIERAVRSHRENKGAIKPGEAGFYNYLAVKLAESLGGMYENPY